MEAHGFFEQDYLQAKSSSSSNDKNMADRRSADKQGRSPGPTDGDRTGVMDSTAKLAPLPASDDELFMQVFL